MSVIAFLRDLLASGLDFDAALIAAERFEQRALAAETARAAERKAKDAARQAAKRERDRHAESRGQPVTARDSRGPSPRAGACAQVVTPFSSSLRSEEVGGGGGECAGAISDDWPNGKATDHAALIVAHTASPRLDPSKSPGLVTTTGRLVAWRRDGASWEHDVLPVVASICAKQKSPVSTWKFFDQAIARSIADNRAALEIPEAGAPRATGPPNDFAARDAAIRAEARRRVLNG